MLFISGFRNKAGKKNYLSKRTNLLSYLIFIHPSLADNRRTDRAKVNHDAKKPLTLLP